VSRLVDLNQGGLSLGESQAKAQHSGNSKPLANALSKNTEHDMTFEVLKPNRCKLEASKAETRPAEIKYYLLWLSAVLTSLDVMSTI
jgi:hypothetical protein